MINIDKKHCTIKFCSQKLKIPTVFVAAPLGVAAAYKIPATRTFVKPLVDFSISIASVCWDYKATLLTLAGIYMFMDYTGLLKACKKAYNKM